MSSTSPGISQYWDDRGSSTTLSPSSCPPDSPLLSCAAEPGAHPCGNLSAMHAAPTYTFEEYESFIQTERSCHPTLSWKRASVRDTIRAMPTRTHTRNQVSWNLFDGDDIAGIHVERFVHGSVAAFTQHLPELVVFYHLSHLLAQHTSAPIHAPGKREK